ncbi:MAG: HAD hydrolase-like protein [Clostridioides sp.]|jgi:FMN phosphatase YigB (HAD superfamily)|nr:HAD hydrolase-like protein [Clostridioides sp.]
MNKSIKDYKAIILDMDGTMYFQFPLRVCMACSLLVYYTIHFWRIKELFLIKQFRGLREKGLLKKSENFVDEETKKIIDFWIYEYPLRFIRMFRDKKLIEMVNKLKLRGTMIIVYSDYYVYDKVKTIDVNIDYCFYSGDKIVNCLKPNSSGLRNILKEIEVESCDCLFIGDRYEKDGVCAKTVGMDFIILGKNPLSRISFYNS